MEGYRYPIDRLEAGFSGTLEESEEVRKELRPQLDIIVKRYYDMNKLSLIARLYYFNRFLFLEMMEPYKLEEIINRHGTQHQRDIVADMISIFT